MSHEQLVEKAARAIHDTDDMADTTWPNSENDDGYRSGNGYVRVCRWPEVYRNAARAALSVVYEAMREPGSDFLATFDMYTIEHDPDKAEGDWQELIAASPLNPEVK